ncbi:MAG: hypothetical protein LBK99_26665 [Opitutaceae bacterium]|jgi:hypothetical protein|nr:hypothetical protein [Opitutaceae bacterium]
MKTPIVSILSTLAAAFAFFPDANAAPAAASAASAVNAAAPAPTILGVNDHILYRTLDEHDAAFRIYAELGARFLRINIDWITLEPEQGKFSPARLENLDYFFGKTKQSRVRLLLSIAYAPAWANGGHQGGGYPPSNDETGRARYADFCEWLVRRYTAHKNLDGERVIEAIEIWNEPDLCDMFFKGYPRYSADAARAYAALVKTAGARLRKIRDELAAPDLLIGAPSISNLHSVQWAPQGQTPWLGAFYEDKEITGFYDVVTVHSYWENSGSTGWLPPELPKVWSDDSAATLKESVLGKIENRIGITDGISLRERMAAAGDGDKEIWLTEIGASARGELPAHKERMVSFAEQREHLADVVTVLRGGRVKNLRRVYWYELFDEPYARREQRYYGLLAFAEKLEAALPLNYEKGQPLTSALVEKPAAAVFRDASVTP